MASCIRSVGGAVAEIVVVHMARLEVVSRGVTCIRGVEEVVVDGDFGSHVGGPADAECFVVLRENARGYSSVR